MLGIFSGLMSYLHKEDATNGLSDMHVYIYIIWEGTWVVQLSYSQYDENLAASNLVNALSPLAIWQGMNGIPQGQLVPIKMFLTVREA